MCVRIALITLEPCEARAFTSDERATFTTVNQPQTLLAGVAESSANASRLIADVQLDNGFRLEPDAAATDRVPTAGALSVGLWWLVSRPVCYFPAQL